MAGIGRGTPIRRKSTPLGDAQGKVSRPIFDFVHFVDDFVPKAHDFSEVNTEDEQSDKELKSEIEKFESKRNVKQNYDCNLNKENKQKRKQIIRSQENLRIDTKIKLIKMENKSSKRK